MYNRGIQERRKEEEKEKEFGTPTSVFDELTKTHIFVYLNDIKNYGNEKAMELARERQKKEKLFLAETQKQKSIVN